MALTDLYMRATPEGSEALGFSLMVSVRNLSLFGVDWLGAKAMETYHIQFSTMAIANGVVSLIALPFIFYLPAILVDRRDRPANIEAIPAPAAKTVIEAYNPGIGEAEMPTRCCRSNQNHQYRVANGSFSLSGVRREWPLSCDARGCNGTDRDLRLRKLCGRCQS